MSKKIAIIGSGAMAVNIADEAKKMGISSHSFSNNPSDIVVGHSDMHHTVDIFNIEEVVAICKKLEIGGVLPTTDLTVHPAAQIAHQLGLNGLPVHIASKVADKGCIRDMVSELTQIKQPSYLIWEVGDELPVIKNYPVVVKPTRMAGKRGVSIAETEKNLKESLNYAIKGMHDWQKRIILEEYIPSGKEYNTEILSYHGKHHLIQTTENVSSGPPHFTNLGQLQPARISEKMREKIEKAVTEMLTEVGIDNTVTCTEIKIHEDEVYLIEINPRLPGDNVAYLTELSTGYPYIQAAIKIALNEFEEPDTSKFKNNASGIIFVSKHTAQFKPLFDKSESYPWLYKKNKVTDDLKEITINVGSGANYMIYAAEKEMPIEISDLLEDDLEKTITE